MPKVSVIIPTYNCASYITEAINSILYQTYKDIEIIVVDDGSQDDTQKILQPYIKSKKIIYIYQSNQGPGAARNTGMERAKGEYICFLDSDDILLKQSIEKRINFLIKHSEVQMVFTDYYSLSSPVTHLSKPTLKSKKFLKLFSKAIEKQEKNEIIFNENFVNLYILNLINMSPISTITVMFKKKIIEKVGNFKTELYSGEDREFWIRIMEKYKIGYIDEPLSIYNKFRSNLTKGLEAKIHSLQFYSFLLEKIYRQNKNLLKKILNKFYFNLGWEFFEKKAYCKSRKFFKKSLLYNIWDYNSWKCFLISYFFTFIKFKININFDLRNLKK